MGSKYKFYEFFAGAGMARAGLGDAWYCAFANDSDDLKRSCYIKNWSEDVFDSRDVSLVSIDDLDGLVDLAWASFPCQDLSQAGAKLGIGRSAKGEPTRSGAVWPFLDLIGSLSEKGRHPTMLVLENVVGLLNSNAGTDFRSICTTLRKIGYRFGAVLVDAAHFVPQSRPRVFIIAARSEVTLPAALHTDLPQSPWHDKVLLKARASLSAADAKEWVWWMPGAPPTKRKAELIDLIEMDEDAGWNSNAETKRLLGMMAPHHRSRLAAAKAEDRPVIGSLYFRMRPGADGENVQRAEIAFGPTLGCLRTPKGGSSCSRIILVDGKRVRTRKVSRTEAALLMGFDANFYLPEPYYHCFRVIGDGVVPAVVRFIADRILEPLAAHAKAFVSSPKVRKAVA